MSMLAERKRKTKWVIHPTRKPLWTEDSNGLKFGKELMEKMGWTTGKGLGVNEQGIQEPLKISYKNDTKGMGFKGCDDWLEQQDEFNELLNQLRSDNFSSSAETSQDRIVKSLEEKSKQSRARVHYQKFTRGKDLSRYSENDLSCILGTNKIKKEKSKTEDVIQTKPKVVSETTFGVTTVNGGFIQDYFKKKWIIDKRFNNSSNEPGDEAKSFSKNCQKTETNFVKSKQGLKSESEEDKIKKTKYKSDSKENLYINGIEIFEPDKLDTFENNHKNKKTNREFKESNAEELIIVKKKKKYGDCNFIATINVPESENHLVDVLNYEPSKNFTSELSNCSSVKKRKVEKNLLKSDAMESEKIYDYDYVAEKKKKINHEYNCTSEVSFAGNLCRTDVKFTLEEEINEKRKKKKTKKEKFKEVIEFKNESSCISEAPLSSQNQGKVCLEEDIIEKKKKKDSKEKYLSNKDSESKYYNNNDNESFYDHETEKNKIEKGGKINEIVKKDDALDLNTIEKIKKKKFKEVRLKKDEEEKNCHSGSSEKFYFEKELKVKNTDIAEQKDTAESQLLRKKEKKKKSKAEKSDEKEKEVDIAFSCEHPGESILKETPNKTNIEKMILDTTEQENESETHLLRKKQKKKKSKAEKSDEKEKEVDIASSCEHPGESILKETPNKTNIEKMILDTTEQENESETHLLRKKQKKKKSKAENSDEKEKEVDIAFSCEHAGESILKETPNKTNIEKMILGTNVQEIIVESESYQKSEKKKGKEEKKKKHEREKRNIECYTDHAIKMQVLENSSEIKPIKKKERKKEKREKLDAKERGKMEFSSDHIEKAIVKEIPKATNINNVNIDLTKIELVKKRNDEKNEKFIKNNVIEKLNGKSVEKNVDLSNNNKKNAFHLIKEDKEVTGVHTHKVELLNEKRADKFYPGKHTNDRVLRLFRWADITGFKGSNLDSVMGYGFLPKYGANKSN